MHTLEKQKGAWDTGYREYNGNIFIFANIGMPGRTGHDYQNYWDGDSFHWEAKTNSHINQPLIQRMIKPSPDSNIYIFTRTDNKEAFIFEGKGEVYEFFDTTPVKIVWRFLAYENNLTRPEIIPEEISEMWFMEGASQKVLVNKYERNPQARRACISHYGTKCQACKFDFSEKYGELGAGFIHVHHIIQLAIIPKPYKLDPVKDLIPVCANCHSIIHRRSEPLSVEELRMLIKNRSSTWD